MNERLFRLGGSINNKLLLMKSEIKAKTDLQSKLLLKQIILHIY